MAEKTIYEFSDFRLDLREGLLLRHGRPVSIQTKTFELLCALIRRRGHVVTRDELMDELWADTFVDDNNLSQHVRFLRRALGDGSEGHRYIETVPRRGYRFLDDGPPAAPLTVGAGTAAEAGNGHHALIGREEEIAEIERLLGSDGVRLVALVGIGGTGKTTLARAVTARMRPEFRDGVLFAELSAINDPDLVLPKIAEVMGIQVTGERAIDEVLRGYVKDKHLLLVVDNFEQVQSAAPVLADIANSAKGVKVLVTSRSMLRLGSAVEFHVPPLKLPPASERAAMDVILNTESVQLFISRAQAVRPAFAPDNDGIRCIAEICSRLDGLPLAIELAAARVRVISPASILERLDRRLDLLAGGDADVPARQQTIRNTLQWSYDLLTDDDRSFFRRLAVFPGSFTFEAAEAICSVRAVRQIRNLPSAEPSLDALESITSLLTNSLLIQRPDAAAGEGRFAMLGVVREYARERLEASGEAAEIAAAHAAYFLDLAERAEPLIQGTDAIVWLDRLEDEHDNLRGALGWAIENEPEAAARLAAALRFFWLFHTHVMEGHKWIRLAFEAREDWAPEIRSKLLNGLGVGARIQGDYERAEEMHREALRSIEEAGDRREIALCHRGLGAVAARKGDFDAAEASFKQTLEISRELNDRSEIGYSLGSLGNLARIKGENAWARMLLEESLTTFRQLGQTERVITNLLGLGLIACEDAETDHAVELFVEGLSLAAGMKDKLHTSDLLDGIAALLGPTEQTKAARLAGAAESLRNSIGYEQAPNERRFRIAYTSALQKAMGENAFELAYAEGIAMSFEEAIATALGERT